MDKLEIAIHCFVSADNSTKFCQTSSGVAFPIMQIVFFLQMTDVYWLSLQQRCLMFYQPYLYTGERCGLGSLVTFLFQVIPVLTTMGPPLTVGTISPDLIPAQLVAVSMV